MRLVSVMRNVAFQIQILLSTEDMCIFASVFRCVFPSSLPVSLVDADGMPGANSLDRQNLPMFRIKSRVESTARPSIESFPTRVLNRSCTMGKCLVAKLFPAICEGDPYPKKLVFPRSCCPTLQDAGEVAGR